MVKTKLETNNLDYFWKNVPIELKLVILSYLPEKYLWALKDQYPSAYYNQAKATCCPANNFRILNEASKGCVFPFLRKLRVEQRPVFRSITPALFPMLEKLTIIVKVESGNFQELPAHHRLRTLTIRGPLQGFSLDNLIKFPNLESITCSQW